MHPNLARLVVESGYGDERHSSQSDIARKKSLVKHERSRIDPEQRDYYYRKHVLGAQNVSVNPSTTGLDPTTIGIEPSESSRSIALKTIPHSTSFRHRQHPFSPNLRPETTANTAYSYENGRGKILYDESGVSSSNTRLAKDDSKEADSSINKDPFLADNERTIADDDSSSQTIIDGPHANNPKNNPFAAKPPPRFPSLWMVFCYVITFWAPGSVLTLLGMPKASHSAWREKMGLIAVILSIGAIVGFLTFGLTQSICDTSVNRLRNNEVGDGFLIVNGRAYDLTRSTHPAAAGIPSGSNVLYPPINAAGMDATFLFQNVNYDCKGLITPKDNCTIPHDSEGNVGWYFPCKLFAQNGTTQVNQTWDYYAGYACHTSSSARDAFYSLDVAGDVYFTWQDIHNATRNLVVYGGDVLDLDLLDWIDTSNLDIPSEFTDFKNNRETLRGTDISLNMTSARSRQISRCMAETIKIGSIDSDTVGCIASKVVLYVSLVFILAIVILKFAFACFFNWVISWRTGAPIAYDKQNLKKREEEIEEWSNNIHRHATLGDMATPMVPQEEQDAQVTPSTVNTKESSFVNTANPFANSNLGSRVSTISNYATKSLSQNANRVSMSGNTLGQKFRRKDNPVTMSSQFQSSTSKLIGNEPSNIYDLNNSNDSRLSFASSTMGSGIGVYPMAPSAYSSYGPAGSIHECVVPQPPLDYQPFGFPLAHTICLVTAYSEDEEGLRTTFDSVATTDYPNSHKLIFVICDGIIKGSGNDRSTPDIVLDMMTDFLIPRDEVQAYSYVAVAQGSKRQNMAKVYCGFYSYDDASVEPSQQQRVPMVCIVKCGTPAEELEAKKPGNRGKRDSQVILMNFLQKVMFDERMTELDYEMFNGIWRITGMSPDFYEICLMVDADTKVFPDSLTHMAAAMVEDPQVMGLCGETKIANKRESWVTAIQVFEYFISHHQTKAFESCFGGVTCLPGCFSMYRIKAPKGPDGYWVPILANPDIVEHYADNVVDTLHKKNLLLLGEDRYLTTLMLRTFPKRKQIFVPRAVCKTTVPAQFRVLLSQRRRWINSTVHNLFELLFVNDLCGVFCISMQFVVFIELIGTLVLPAALAFTLYVAIISIVQRPVPIIPLVLLALVLGLPGVLIVVTAKHASYLLWMAIYILALPIWNFVLPSYAYWKFDDFSWGETRAVAGEKKGGGHEDGDGEFDSSQIVMKQWKDFERERREQLALKAQQGTDSI